MTYEQIRAMMYDIRQTISKLNKYITFDGKKGTIKVCTQDMVTFNYFWNYETDMPTCNCDQLDRVVANTVEKILKEI